MGVEWVAGLMVLIALLAVGGAALLFFRGEPWLLQWLRGSAGVLLVALSLYMAFVAASLFSYQEAPGADPLVTVSFEKAGEQSWNVTLAEANGATRVYEMKGDLWQLDVRLLRYAGIASIFGVAPSFQLDRLAGRYLTVEDERDKPRTDVDLHVDPFLGYDIWDSAGEEGNLFVRGVLSSIALVPASDGAIFAVVLDAEGLLSLQPSNSVAEDALKSVGG